MWRCVPHFKYRIKKRFFSNLAYGITWVVRYRTACQWSMSDLASAWRFRLPQDDPIIGDDEWNFDWLNPECSTGDPTPRTFHATLFLITYHTNDPWHDLTNFFIMLNRTTKRKLSLQKLEAIDESRAWISVKEGGEQLLEGTAFINTASMGTFAS